MVTVQTFLSHDSTAPLTEEFYSMDNAKAYVLSLAVDLDIDVFLTTEEYTLRGLRLPDGDILFFRLDRP